MKRPSDRAAGSAEARAGAYLGVMRAAGGHGSAAGTHRRPEALAAVIRWAALGSLQHVHTPRLREPAIFSYIFSVILWGKKASYWFG